MQNFCIFFYFIQNSVYMQNYGYFRKLSVDNLSSFPHQAIFTTHLPLYNPNLFDIFHLTIVDKWIT